MSAVERAEASARPGGTIAVLLGGMHGVSEAMAVASAVADGERATVTILSVARRLPLGAYCGAWGLSPPWSARDLRAEALEEAAAAAAAAAALAPSRIPVRHRVVLGSPRRAVEQLHDGPGVVHVVIDRDLGGRWPLTRQIRRSMPTTTVGGLG